MEHTYLRYECGDSFGLTAAAPSSQAPAATDSLAWLPTTTTTTTTTTPVLLTVAGSLITGWNLKTASLALKMGHTEQLSGGVGTGRALNSDQMVCLAASAADGRQVATGWVDGSVRIFTIPRHDRPLSHSLLDEDTSEETFLQSEPLVLQGHSSAVRALVWHESTLLASAANDGAIVIWDVVAESGLYRLRGHRGPVTQLVFHQAAAAATATTTTTSTARYLISTSLDQLVKVWDLQAQVCIQTIATHRGEVTCAASVGSARLITGASDGHVRVWNLARTNATTTVTDATAPTNNGDDVNEASKQDSDKDKNMTKADDSDADQLALFMGRLLPPPNVATSAEKIMAIHTLKSRWLGVLHGSRMIHIYRKRGQAETLKKKQRRLKRKQQKQQKEQTTSDNKKGRKRGLLDDDVISDDDEDAKGNPLAQEEQGLDPEQIKASDEFEYITTIRPSHKVRDFIFHPQTNQGQLCRVVCSLSTNALEVHSIIKDKQVFTSEKSLTMDGYGHPTGIRAVSLSSDDRLACTVSKNSTKIWNVHRRSLVQTLSPIVQGSKAACYGLCVAFLPGNTLVVMGTREGHLLLIDIASGNVLSYEQGAHDGAIWNVDVRKTTTEETSVSLVTGSADKTVKFWDVVLDEEEDRPVLEHTRTLQMTDDVVAVKYSHSTDPTRRMIFVSTLDSTIKVFYEDSLKLFLSLYGHKLPALTVDASDDDVLLVSGAADKTIKIWGLDFGDTHRTLHGHEDSITDIRMVPKTHNFFTSSKDGTIRYWDGDRFEQVLILPGHFAEVQCLAMSRTGAFVLSGGMDRQVRVWERTKDIVFLQEERERALEQVFDKVDARNEGGTAEILDRKGQDGNEEEGEDGPQSEMAVKRSILSVAAGDRLLEALEKADQELKEISLFKKNNPGKSKAPNMYLLGLEPAAYVLWVLKSIKTADLEQSLLVLPSTHLERLFYYLIVSLRAGRGVELCSRVAVFMVKAHQNQIIANEKSFAVPLRELKRLVRHRVSEARDRVGYDIAALRLIAKTAQERKSSFLTHDDSGSKDVWAGLGLGSDLAAALYGRPNKKR